jgi:hypothetical protein
MWFLQRPTIVMGGSFFVSEHHKMSAITKVPANDVLIAHRLHFTENLSKLPCLLGNLRKTVDAPSSSLAAHLSLSAIPRLIVEKCFRAIARST